MVWIQRNVLLPAKRRGFHLITQAVIEALPEISSIHIGLLHVFLQHTSASLTINENADPDVPADLESAMDSLVPEDFPHRHTVEGPDDMPAHMKTSLLGSSISVPVQNGKLCLGSWQGIYLCEHRNRGGKRQLVLTLQGERPTKH
jgi:secondary thiamine-phosphate synthase enzyme